MISGLRSLFVLVKFFYIYIICCFCVVQVHGQVQEPNKMYIPKTNTYTWEIDPLTKDTTQYFFGDVQAYQGDVFMFCDTAQMRSEIITAKGNVVFVQNDTIQVYADSVVYNSITKNAKLYYNVTLDNVKQKLYTDFLFYDFSKKQATFRDTAIMQRESTFLQSKRGVYNVDTEIASFYDDVILRDSLLSLRCDSLRYDMNAEQLIFLCPTAIDMDSSQIYCEGGYHSLVDDFSFLTGNPQFLKNDQKATGDTISYDRRIDAITIYGNGRFEEKDKIAVGDYLYFEASTDKSILKGNASYVDSSYTIRGQEIYRNPTTGEVEVYHNAFVSNPPTLITGDSLRFNENTEDGIARGHVIWRDTTNATTIFCDAADYNTKEEKIKATNIKGRPYLESIMDDDTTYLAADTLFSKVMIQEIDSITTDTSKLMIAYPRAKIFKTDMQAVCDSLVFNRQDSIFYLFDSPIIWSDSTQFVGDTMHIIMKNDEVNEIKIMQNSFISSEVDEETYNQIKGRNVNAYFLEGAIDKMLVIGNAESIYYIKDEEDAYIGANKTVCSRMWFYFKDKELDNIRFFDLPTSVMTPVEEVNPYSMRIDGFKWHIDKRPLSLQDILNADMRIMPKEFIQQERPFK